MIQRPRFIWAFLLCALVGLRIAFFLGTPLLDNDSTVIFFGAREFAANFTLSKVNTLPVLFAGLLYKIFGEHILLARLPQFLGGLGCMALIWRIGQKSGKFSGAIGASIFAVLPLAVLYGSITKPYSLIAFFVLGGACLYGRSVEKQSPLWAAIAGVSFTAAFLCYTFAASSAFPLLMLFIAGVFFKKYRPHLKPSLIAGLTFGLLLFLIILWRWKEFGWSITSDYVTDWRFDVATMVWGGRWVGLADVWALGIAVFVPAGFFLALHRESLKNLGPLASYGLIFCVMNLLVWLFNPVNHFPRVLLPSLPLMSLFAGCLFNPFSNRRKDATILSHGRRRLLLAPCFCIPDFAKGTCPCCFSRPKAFRASA